MPDLNSFTSASAQNSRHPCFSAEACHKYARIHLPVAPACNIQCNYCNRKFDCVNESRPGVTSEVLEAEEALEKFLWVKSQIADLSVVGIAGPGEALANWPKVRKTLELIRQSDNSVLFCLSSNGLLMQEHIDELIALGVSHFTITLNAVDPAVSAGIYQYITWQGRKYEGVEAAGLLLENQLRAISSLTMHSVMLKINIVMIRGINDTHIPTVVEKMKRLGVRITNIMPLIPAPGSNFAHFPQTSQVEVNELRNRCAKIVPQMRHCQQCRADAVGRLGEDRSQEFRRCNYKNTLQPAATAVSDLSGSAVAAAVPVTFTDKDALSGISGTAHAKAARYRIAVTSRSGRLIDQHFGHATVFRIYQMEGQNFSLLEERDAAQYCQGTENCYAQTDMREQIIKILQDCDGVLTMRAGHHAKESLAKYDILPVESCDSIENGLRYAAQLLTAAKN